MYKVSDFEQESLDTKLNHDISFLGGQHLVLKKSLRSKSQPWLAKYNRVVVLLNAGSKTHLGPK